MLDYSLCSLCGQCVMACPAGALRFSQNVYLVVTDRGQLHMDLLARLRSKAAQRQQKSEAG